MWTSWRKSRDRVVAGAVLSPSDLRRSWPTPPQEELLRLLLSSGPVLPLWDEWRSRWSVDADGVEVYRLLPSLYERLAKEGVEGGRYLRGVSRHCYAAGVVQQRAGAEISSTLGREGIPTLALKGLALSATLGNIPRHMCDVDILVPRSRAEDALRAVTSAGWESDSGLSLEDMLSSVDRVHARGLRRGDISFDLHWRSTHQDQSDAFDAPLWERAVDARGTLVPSKTDLLLQVAMHGVRRDSRTHVWPLDLITLYAGAEGPILWQQIVETALRRRLVIQATVLAETLEAFIPGSVPGEVRDLLTSQDVSAMEVLEHRGTAGSARALIAREMEFDAIHQMIDARRCSPGSVISPAL